jgi:uncharacterized protein (DUF2141 family)
MVSKNVPFSFLILLAALAWLWIVDAGCAQIGIPTGGLKDSLPPELVSANPANKSIQFKGNKIVLNFNEYVDIQEPQNNVLVSPFPKTNPLISYKLKKVIVQLKDTLQENTTYVINFGNSIKDVNEGNVLKNFVYVFSTGATIDSLTLSGKVTLAETGKTDSTLSVMLYKNAPDSAIKKRRPDYFTKLNGTGQFEFTNLSAGEYRLYALKDGDGGKTYNSPTELFAFLDTTVILSGALNDIKMMAYAEEKEKPRSVPAPTAPKNLEKRFRVTNNFASYQQGITDSLVLNFTRIIKDFNASKILLIDTLKAIIPQVQFFLDSTKKNLTVKAAWPVETSCLLILNQDAFTDTAGNNLTKTDTLRFVTKRREDYGTLQLRFKNFDSTLHPVMQFVTNSEVVRSVQIKSATWSDQLFKPGEYELRILYDKNNNCIWDPGNYRLRIQPERVITLDKSLNIKPNWDNERDIEL